MASTYSINLQAKLDTTSVQQELKKLRSAQQDVQAVGVSAQNGGMGNINGLDSTLTKLNTTMLNLQKAIERLSGRVSQNNGEMQSSNKIQQQAVQTVGRGGFLPVNWKAMSATAQRQTAHEWYMSQPNSLGFEQWVAAQERAGTRFTPRRGFSERQRARLAYSNYEQRLWQDALAKKDATAQRQQMIRSMRQNRQIAGLFASQLVGGAADIAGQLGMDRAQTFLGALGSGMTAGFGTASAITMAGGANPASATAGAIAGIATFAVKLVSGLNDLAKAAEQAAEAQKVLADRIREAAQRQDVNRFSFQQEYDSGKGLQSRNFREARQKREEFEKKYEEARAKFMGMESSESVNDRLRKEQGEEAKRLNRAIHGDGSFGSWVSRGLVRSVAYLTVQKTSEQKLEELPGKYNKKIQDYQKDFDKAKNDMETAKSAYESWKATEEGIGSIRAAWNQAVIQRRGAARLNTEQFEFARRGDASVIGSQAFALGIIRNMRMHPRDQFGKLSDELTDLRNQRNAKLNEAYAMNERVQNAGTNLSPARLESLLKERDRLMKEAGFFDQRISVIENALTQIKELVPHSDFSGVTSLAQYGFNMGERDDRDRAMENYYSNMESLTRQIRDKLDEGITTQAVYGE